MANRIKRGVIVVVFSLLVFVGSVPAAYAALTTVPLNVWNNAASSGVVLVVISPGITATSGTITVSFADPVDARATIDKFSWNGTATLTFASGVGIDGAAVRTSWTQSAGTGFNADG